jgi:hypothetical protein
MFRFWQTLASAGWQTIAWSDGTTPHNTPIANAYPYSSGAIGFTTAGGGTNGVDNTRAWMVMQQPPSSGALTVGGNYAGTRQLVWQRSAVNNQQWRIKYSFSGGYTAPSVAGTATNTPVINAGIGDEAYIAGGGSDASPTFDQVFGAGTNGGSRLNVMADDGFFVSGSNSYPYGFYLITWTAGASAGTETEHMMDPMISGSAPAGDIDPFVFRRMSTAINNSVLNPYTAQQFFGRAANANGVAQCWFRLHLQGAQFTGLAGVYYTRGNSNNGFPNSYPQQTGANINSNEDDLLPVIMARGASVGGFGGYKGLSSLLRYTSSIKTTGTSMSVNSNRDRLVANTVTVPWDGSLPLV